MGMGVHILTWPKFVNGSSPIIFKEVGGKGFTLIKPLRGGMDR